MGLPEHIQVSLGCPAKSLAAQRWLPAYIAQGSAPASMPRVREKNMRAYSSVHGNTRINSKEL